MVTIKGEKECDFTKLDSASTLAIKMLTKTNRALAPTPAKIKYTTCLMPIFFPSKTISNEKIGGSRHIKIEMKEASDIMQQD